MHKATHNLTDEERHALRDAHKKEDEQRLARAKAHAAAWRETATPEELAERDQLKLSINTFINRV